MNNTIQIPFALGVQIWWTGNNHRETWVECPECAGTKVIEMIKGNGERVSLDCELCGPGYEHPRGRVRRTIYEYRPTPFLPLRVRIDGDQFSYSESPPDANCYGSVYSTHLFATREECQIKCDEMNAEHAKADEERLIHQIKSKRKRLAFSASYWRGQIREFEKNIERAKAMLNRCKPEKTAA